MLSKNFLSKTLNSISVLAVSGVLLGSALTSSSRAMETLKDLPLEMATNIVRTLYIHSECECNWDGKAKARSKPYKNVTLMGQDSKDLFHLRGTSNFWKQAVEFFISSDKVLMYHCKPLENTNKIFLNLLPIVTSIKFGHLNEKQATYIEGRLPRLKNKLSSILNFECDTNSEKGYKAIGAALPYFPNLQCIQISESYSRRIGYMEVVNRLDTQKQLVEIYLYTQFEKLNIPGRDEIIAIAKELSKLENLKRFYIGDLSSIQKEDMDYLTKKIEEHKLLYKSDLKLIINTEFM